LEDSAHDRGARSLWPVIKEKADTELIAWLSSLTQSLPNMTVFQAVNHILNMPTPNGYESGWQAMMARLGHDCFDPLEELITMAQTYDSDHAGAGVTAFLSFMRSNTNDIKRDLDEGQNMVRIMTVHASKGLQSKIVILPDTLSIPKSSGRSDDGLIWMDNGDLPLWSYDGASQCDAIIRQKEKMNTKNMNEYNRLLYVALTRAEEHLIICGALNKKQNDAPGGSWYESCLSAIIEDAQEHNWGSDSDYCTKDAKHLIFEPIENQNHKREREKKNLKQLRSLPDWASKPITKNCFRKKAF